MSGRFVRSSKYRKVFEKLFISVHISNMRASGHVFGRPTRKVRELRRIHTPVSMR